MLKYFFSRPKPFYKKPLFVVFLSLIFVSIMFLIYQVKFVNQLQNPTEHFTERLSREMKITKPNNSGSNGGIIEISPKDFRVLKGIRIRDIDNYTKKFKNQKFQCLDKSKEIPWDKLNDDFCDCKDGSDETFTNAVRNYFTLRLDFDQIFVMCCSPFQCSNGKFYCTKQTRHLTGRGQDVYVPSSRINDGICDCKLDCSDEFSKS